MISTLKRGGVLAALAAVTVAFTACSTTDDAETSNSADGETITITTNTGEVEVPVNPERVVVLDNTAAETVEAFGITPVAVPKQLFSSPALAEWVDDDEIADVGTHSEPKFDVIEDVDPTLIIGGYRFSKYSEELEKIAEASNGVFIDIAASDTAPDGRVAQMVTQTKVLGEIFGKQEQAEEIVTDFQAKLDAAKKAATGQTVFLANVNGGKIDNGSKRLQPLVEPLNLVDVFGGEGGDIHQNSGLTPEAIAQANPEWVIVMDRDAAVARGDDKPTPAQAVFDAQEAFADSAFMKDGHLIILDPKFYVREGIQGYGESYEQIANAMGSTE